MMRTDIYYRLLGLPAVLLAAFLFLPRVGHTQDPVSFESTGPTRDVTEGSTFEVSFSLKNVAGKRFIAPDFKGSGFQVAAGPVEMRGAGFINGQSYSHQTWSYTLEAGKAGVYTIGPATVQTSNQTLRTQPLTIRVVPARQGRSKPAPNTSNDRLFLSGELDREVAWLGQQVHFQIKLYTQVNISDFDILDLPSFDAFYTLERRRFDTRTQYETIRGKRYAVRVLYETSLFPQETGELLLGAARVRLGVEQPGSISSLFGSTPVLMQTQPVKLQVKPLPEPAPPGFSGAVGHYEWKVSADKDTLSTDDALTLTVTLQGNGDTRRFANPHFDWPPELEGFDPRVRDEKEYETGDQFVHTRTLEYVVLPKHPGDYLLRPALIVFDPDSNSYRTLPAERTFSVHVVPGPQYGKNAPLTDTLAGSPPVQTPFGVIWQSAGAWVRSPLLWGGLCGAALLALVFFWWKKRKTGAASIPLDAPARLQPKEARERLMQAYFFMQNSDTRVFYHELLKALQGYLAARLNMPPAALSKEILREKLAERQTPGLIIDALAHVWERCEQAVFAGQARAGDMNDTWKQTESAVQQLDAFLRS